MLRLGRYELYSVVTGAFRLDGGAMFGIVPKALWGNAVEFDEANRIFLATRTLLAVDRDAHRVILADTGCGTKWSKEHAARYAIEHDRDAIPNALAAIGVSIDDVTDIVVTHLHFDHNGGLTEWFDDPGSPAILRFPKARHWIHKSQWDHAHNPNYKDRASYLKEDFDELERAGVLRFVEGEQPGTPWPGVEWFISQGHSPYQLLPVFTDGTTRLHFVGDLIPTIAHLRLGWVMAYDLFPLTTIREKEMLFRGAIEQGWLIAFPHDPKIGGVALGGTLERPIVTRTLPL
jgi:glyoxylase-like metal-dependent hydrolase (beta-lactamase superfamily II)